MPLPNPLGRGVCQGCSRKVGTGSVSSQGCSLKVGKGSTVIWLFPKGREGEYSAKAVPSVNTKIRVIQTAGQPSLALPGFYFLPGYTNVNYIFWGCNKLCLCEDGMKSSLRPCSQVYSAVANKFTSQLEGLSHFCVTNRYNVILFCGINMSYVFNMVWWGNQVR